MNPNPNYAFEQRLEGLREEARQKGRVTGKGVLAAGGPMLAPARGLPEIESRAPGYFGLPVLKPHVWQWMIPVYFFIGGLAGMSALIALGGMIAGSHDLIRVAIWIAAAGAIVSPILLAADLGRPMRFLNMLRVLKPQSPMSVGSWILTAFVVAVVPAAILTEFYYHGTTGGSGDAALQIAANILIAVSALIGIFLSTHTGVLISATAVPAWFSHRALLPMHFGVIGLGSAASLLVLIGFNRSPLIAVGIATALVETAAALWLLVRRHGAVDRALHRGRSGLVLQLSELLTGPIALALWLTNIRIAAALCFLAGSILSRFGWLDAGRASACDPESLFASQRPQA